MFEISSDCFTFISLHVVTFYFFSYLTDEKIKEAAGYANDRAEFVFYFFFRLDYFFTCMNMLLSCLSGKPMLPTCLSLSGLCWIGFTFVRNRFESNSNSWMTSSIVYNIFATRRTGRKKLFLEITTYLMTPTAVHGQK